MSAEDFVNQPEVKRCLKDLKTVCGQTIFSDLVDDAGHQYVDLVMEGGGVLGIALVGYTYALESVGLRFRSVGGASAGAINATLVAGLGPVEAAKSLKTIELLGDLDMAGFVDGDSDVKDLVESYLEGSGKIKLLWKAVQVLDTLNENLGLNPGGSFYGWISRAMLAAGVPTNAKLAARMATVPAGFRLRSGEPLPFQGTGARLALVTADVSTETKVEFPKMAPMYWNDPDAVDPAQFVRASMSIPFFFYPMRLGGLPKGPKAKEAWKTLAAFTEPIPDLATFIDGGIMSNFPIDLFHAYGRVPAAPTFGAKLGLDHRAHHEIHTPVELGGAVFASACHCLDYDFITRHPDYNKLVAWIDTGDHNWLNFFMPTKDKVDLFRRGVLAGADFLKTFDWEAYKILRGKMAAAYT